MKKHEKMVSMNELLSREKVNRATNAIIKMEKEGGVFSVTELMRRTGLSRSFFYKNMKVRERLDMALNCNRNIEVREQKNQILNDALQAKIKLLEKEINALQLNNDMLKQENSKLTRIVEQLEIELLRAL